MRLNTRRASFTTSSIALGALLAACSETGPYRCTNDDECPIEVDAGSIRPPPERQTDAGTIVRPSPRDRPPARPAADGGEVAPSDAGAPPVAAPEALSDRKVDLLLMVDNSISMSDKQSILGRTAADFLAQLTNPPCVDAAGTRSAAPSPTLACPEGTRREFPPVHDINIAVISSSLGDAGADVACTGGERDDRAHTLGSLPRGLGNGTNAAGVLELRPGGDIDALGTSLQAVINSVGQSGCGWEMSLESWYRFAVDPFPYERLERVVCPGADTTATNCVQPATDEDGALLLDTALLEQRAAFFRPDSLVAIVMLSDENDCSLSVGGQSWVVAAIDDARPMFRGSSVCETNPNDACCYSCALGAPIGCEADPICAGDPEAGVLPNRLPANEDGLNLRCFEQKRRFGIDFLYPVQRYVNALSQRELCVSSADLAPENCAQTVPNPLFAAGREPSSVFLSGIVGVPWQEIASELTASGEPLPAGELRFKSPSELSDADWNDLVGSSAASPPVPPGSPFMIESATQRPGIAPANPINGREYATEQGSPSGAPDDLEYACIFPLAQPRDCSALDRATGAACDCFAGSNDRPLCEAAPGESAPGTMQFFAKAYPGLRQLEVLRARGDNAALGSICARNVTDASRTDFGYRPAMSGLLERMRPELTRPSAP